MLKRLPAVLLVLVVVAGATLEATELVLKDGRVIVGVEVHRDDDNFVLTLKSGDSVVLPAVLVDTVRLTGQVEPLTEGEPEQVGGQPPPDGPSGLRQAEPQVLAGIEVDSPTPSEQLRVLGKPARFQANIVDNEWQPSSDWNMDPEHQNNFAPSTWQEGVIDPAWEPESAFDADEDVLDDSRSTFQKGVIDSTWTPTDGFAN